MPLDIRAIIHAILSPQIVVTLVLLLLLLVFVAGLWISKLRMSPGMSRTSIRVSLVAVFAGMSLGTNYAMTGLVNVKLMDALVFIAGFLFGLDVGVGVAVLTWTVYGFVNPYGQAGFPLLFFLMIGECFYAIAGAALRRTTIARQLLSEGHVQGRLGYLFAVVGLFATFAYDVLTNFASYLFLVSSLYEALLIGMVTGAPFALVHEASNLFFFSTVAPAAILAARRLGLNMT